MLVNETACAVKALVPALDALEIAIETLARDNGSELADISSMLTNIEERTEAIEQSLALISRKHMSNTDDPLGKLTNSMLYTRHMWADQEEFRTKYLSDEIGEDSAVSKHPNGTKARWHAEGRTFWHKFATPSQKTEIRDAFTRWKEERSCAQLPEPLVDNE